MTRLIKRISLICLVILCAAAFLAGCNTQEDNNITLLASNPGGNEVSTFSVVNPDMTLSPFVIPNNRVFIITDMDITFANAAPDRIVYVQLLLFGGDTLASFQDAKIADANGDGGLHASLESGVKINQNTSFGVRATSGDAPNPSGIVVNLHGYFE